MDTSPFLVEPGTAANIADRSTRKKVGFDGSKTEGKRLATGLAERLSELQRLFWADGRHKVLVVLQAMDTGGKDSTIRHVFHHTNPQGVKVHGFRQPSTLERAHDYLWRAHARTPGDGEIAVFNRSHYEDVLVVRVHSLVDEDRWRRRYRHIREWERMLAEEGTTIRKFFLHISHDEQRERLQDRIDDPSKHWKFDPGDIDERKRWDDYQAAFEEAITETSTEWAPWYVVPADRKWFRNIVIGQALVDTLEGLDLRYPPPAEGITDLVVR
ncbi:MAG: PPK2 family polyphosphate kinase [Actinomycetota bacterium]|nr:PPK2 family polyphosphate kinase [Actinomycetota bacterium]